MSASSAPVVEVQGTWLENLGARQLLDATVRGVRGERADVVVAIDPRWGRYAMRADLGLAQVVPREMPGRAALERTLDLGSRVAPRAMGRLFDDYGLTRRADIGGLVDASGFALSDQWGPRKAAQRWQVVERYVRRGRPVVLLPQALGPFTDRDTARFARQILDRADRVWVRDRCSLRHVHDLVGEQGNVDIAPDVTILEHGDAPDGPVADVIIVPNGRMIDQGGWDRSTYLEALRDAACAATAHDCTVEVMLHTSERSDRELGAALAETLGCGLVQECRPRAAKGRLGSAQLVVGSRFHALLGALSQGVPAVAVGWSHKYDELLSDFGVEHLACTPGSHAARPTVEHALSDLDTFRALIAARLPAQRAAVERMWTEARAVLGLRAVLVNR